MALLLVSVGTDGIKDWVRTPDGLKLNLGPHSVLSFVTQLSKNPLAARHALTQFLKKGEAMLSVDEGRLWKLLAPVRARWATDAFMPPLSTIAEQHHFERTSMETVFEHLNRTERVIAWLNKQAAAGRTEPKAFEYLKREAGKIKSPNQSQNSTYYGLGDAKPYEVTDKAAGALTVDVLETNTRIIEAIQRKAEKTASTITRLERAGKKFNASRARADVRAVTSRVATLVERTQLIEPWVRDDLLKLAQRNDHLYSLFHSKG